MDMNGVVTLGQRMVELREQFAISREQAAQYTFISESYVRQIERDEKTPNINIVQRFADLYSMSLSEFLENVEVNRG